MTYQKESRIAEACSLLFGEDFSVESTTIDYLQLSGIKHAFREKVKECHPDISGSASGSAENFIKVKDAYDFLISVKSSGMKPSEAAGKAGKPRTYAVPLRKLRLGEYLYYTGKISWKELISAITWQKQNSNRNRSFLFGLYFIKFGILSSAEIGFSIFKLNIHNSNY